MISFIPFPLPASSMLVLSTLRGYFQGQANLVALRPGLEVFQCLREYHLPIRLRLNHRHKFNYLRHIPNLGNARHELGIWRAVDWTPSSTPESLGHLPALPQNSRDSQRLPYPPGDTPHMNGFGASSLVSGMLKSLDALTSASLANAA